MIYMNRKESVEINSKNKKKVNEFVTDNKINIDEWENFFRELYKGTSIYVRC